MIDWKSADALLEELLPLEPTDDSNVCSGSLDELPAPKDESKESSGSLLEELPAPDDSNASSGLEVEEELELPPLRS